MNDPPRTRTWNLRLRRRTPYPLGQRTICTSPSLFVQGRPTRSVAVAKPLPGRLELPTLRLTASRSNQLSYGSLACVRSRQCDEPLRSGSPAAVAEQGSQDSLPEWSKGVDSSSTSASCVGSNPTAVRCLFRSSRFAAICSGIDRRHWWPSDTEGIRTPAGRAQWISSPSP